jgi:hypothetical protein
MISKKRTFVTFSEGEINNQLTEILKESIHLFSNYDLIVYKKSDFELDYNTDDPEFWKSGNGYIYKVLSCIKSLEEYDEVVWIDTDCIVTNYIDKIWFEGYRVKGYPLLPQYRFNNMQNVDNGWEIVRYSAIYNPDTNRKFYSQACLMFFNKSCLDFYKEVLSYFDNFNSPRFPMGDESIINYLLWKDNKSDNLGHIFLCSAFLHFNLLQFAANTNREEYMICHDYNYVENNFSEILFLHGEKNPYIHTIILNNLKQYR